MKPALRPAAFFDRDGVLNVDKGYVHRIADFEWLPGAQEAIRYANDHDFLVIVITNQSGIARGYYHEDDMAGLHRWMSAELAAQAARIDAFYHCPYHPEGVVERYRRVSDLRKPGPGMILQAIREWRIDPDRSFMIGDKNEDVIAATRAGIRGHLFQGDNPYPIVVKCIAESLASRVS